MCACAVCVCARACDVPVESRTVRTERLRLLRMIQQPSTESVLIGGERDGDESIHLPIHLSPRKRALDAKSKI